MRNRLHKLAALGLTMTLLLGPAGSAETIRLPKSIQVIGEEAFKGDTAIENVVVPEGAKEIGARAFANSSVKKIKLPASLQKIPDNMLSGTKNVTVVAPEGSKAYTWAVANGYNVEAPTSEVPESDHPYQPESDYTWSYTHPEKAYALAVTFSEDTYVEDGYDFIIVTDASGKETTYTGSMLSGRTIFLKGNSFEVRLTSDGSVENYGFRVENIESIATEADFENYGGFSIEEYYDDMMIITGYDGTASELEIPAKIDGKTVIAIGENAFRNNSNLTSVKIADGIEMIGYQAFRGCTSLKSVTMPDSVEYLEGACFRNCTALTSVRLSENLYELAYDMFDGCTSLASVEIPDSVRYICGGAFSNCPSLSSVTIPAGVEYIEEGAFSTDWNGVETDFTKLQKFTVESGNQYYKVVSGMLVETASGTLIAYPRGKTTTSITIPDSISRIGRYAFSYSPNLKSVTVPGSVKSIGEAAFFYCTSLETVVLKSGVQTIERNAFYECRDLTAITIPASVKEMGVDVFSQTDLDNDGYGYALTATVTSGSYAENWCFVNGVPTSTGAGTVTSGDFVFMKLNGKLSLTKYRNYEATSIKVPSSVGGLPVTAVAAEAFAYHEEIESVVIPEGVTAIGNYAFISCISMTSVTLPSTLKEIGVSGFGNCGSMTQITLPSTLKTLGYWVFEGSGLTTITLPSSLSYMEYGAFGYCEQLKSVYIPAAVELELHDDYFFGCHEDFTIYGAAGSFAEEYADFHDIPFVAGSIPA